MRASSKWRRSPRWSTFASMLTKLRALLFVFLTPLALAATAKNCGCDCCKGKEVCCCALGEETSGEAAPRHALRGVVIAVHEGDSTLTVKHEAIPGVMPAMTMVFKVDAPALKVAKKGATITGQMSRQGEDWWLHEVALVEAQRT